MNLVFAIKSLEVQGGGAERVLTQVANWMAERAHIVTIITFDSTEESFYPLHPNIVKINLDVGTPGQPTPRLRLLKSLLTMRRRICVIQPDLVIGFMHSMYVPLGFALLGTGIRLVASEHIGPDHFQGRPLQRWLVRLTMPLFQMKTVPSEAIRAQHAIPQQIKIVALPNPLDLTRFGNSSAVQTLSSKIILSVGRFMAQKNQLELIEAFALLADEFPDWKLRLVGDGEMRPDIETRIAALHLSNRIELPGATREIAAEYANATIVAVPSRYESFGLVTAEALAGGRPVIGFADCPGTNELIQSEHNGILVAGNANRIANLANGLRKLMKDEALRQRLGKAGPSSIKAFSADNALMTWEVFFKKLAST